MNAIGAWFADHKPAAHAPAGADRFEWTVAFLAVIVLISLPFIVGSQPQGAESLNPIEALKSVSNEGDRLKQAILLGFYATFAALLLTRERLRVVFYLGAPMLLLILWTVASAQWSVNPEVTIRRVVALLGTVIMGLHLGIRFGMCRLLVLLCWAGLVVLGMSLVVAVLEPSHGLDLEGRLRGVSAHKNEIANFAALVFLSGVGLATSGATSRFTKALALAVAGLAVLCITLAHSASVMPVLALSLAVLALGGLLRRASGGTIALLPLFAALGVLAAGVVAENSDAVAEILGRDADFSGRTLVWSFAAKMILLRPVAGYGLGAFWVGSNSPGAVFWFTSHLAVPHAHNGFIQLALELGVVGLGLFAVSIVLTVTRLGWLIRHGRPPLSAWPLAFLAFDVVSNYSESWLWSGNELLMVFVIAVIARTNSLHRAAALPAFRPIHIIAGATS